MTVLGAASIAVGLLFFLAGTVGLLRFPDLYCRLHAVTKADTVGLGFLALGTALLSGSLRAAVLSLLIWLLAMAAATVACHLVARHALARAVEPDDQGAGE